MPAQATLRYGALQLSGSFETNDWARHSSINKWQFIQNRNTFRLRVDWDWLQNGKLIEKINIPFIERSKLFLLYRGVYDGVYDIAPGDRQQGSTRFDDLVGGSISDLSSDERSALKFENRLREVYVDLKLKGAPLSFRLGRQQVIWGESDQFRLMDIWNPLDTTWHFQQDSWDNIRVPLWLAKGLWDIGDLGPFSNTFLEVVYNPFDFQPGIKANFLPNPWGLPFPDPLRTGQIQTTKDGSLLSPVFDLQGTSLRRGDFHRNPAEASEVGARFHFVTPQGLELSTNYLYGRGRGVGAAAPFAVKIKKIQLYNGVQTAELGKYQVDVNNPGDPTDPFDARIQPVTPINVQAEVIHPYMHIFGLTGNWFEGDYTSAVLRFESAYAMGEPFQTVDPDSLVIVEACRNGKSCRPNKSLGASPLGFTKRDVWAGMVGFDRPTWIRWLNSKTTWFLTAQFFWNYTTGGHVDQLRGTSGAGEFPYFGPIGKWIKVNPDVARQFGSGAHVGQAERQQLSDTRFPGNADNVRRWEHLLTIAATSFYRGGTIVPFIANAFDPVNMNNEVLWMVDYFYTNDFIITFQQKFFTDFGSNVPSNDPWYAGGRFHRRDETGIKLTYQF